MSHRTRCVAAIGIVLLAAACGRVETPPQRSSSNLSNDDRIKTLADTYLEAYFDRYPEEVTSYGIAGRRHSKLTDNSIAALQAWQSKEDAWLEQVKAIKPEAIGGPRLRATYAILREALEGSIAARVCRTELWPISQQNGWHVQYGFLVTIQPVGDDQARQDAIARFAALPKYIDVEVANLRQGLKEGYSVPKNIVRIVVEQVETLIQGARSDSPFRSPAQRDRDEAFQQQFQKLVSDQLTPAFVRYRDFLSTEYLPAARESIAVSAIPNGAACYSAAVRAHSSVPVLAKQVHELGLSQIEELTAEMRAIGERSFHTSDVRSLLQAARTDRRYLFSGRQELIAYSEAALARAKAAAPKWFGLLPKADVRIEPYPKFREQNAPNEYKAPAEDGSRPALFYISAYQAEKTSKAVSESTAFHETIPGHHLQIAIALERKDIHPLGRYISNSGYSEGWALYAERLADEMKLYSSDIDRLGMLSSQAFRAARLVVDSGIHTMGWSRQQAIDYMVAHTAESVPYLTSEVDRYIIWPGQATAYMLGMLEIKSAREAAQAALGSKFDIRAFHDRVLEDGSVPLTYLSDRIKRWTEQTN